MEDKSIVLELGCFGDLGLENGSEKKIKTLTKEEIEEIQKKNLNNLTR